MNEEKRYEDCRLCPRRCGVNRVRGEKGFCGETASLRIAAAVLHRGEEPPIAGENGSGAVFVSGCNLGCAFCQNFQISRQGLGRVVSIDEFAAICLALQEKGAENVNIVTGTHATPALARGVAAAKARGLTVPVLWNSSAYEDEDTLALLQGLVDIFLPDMKTLDAETARAFLNAPDYPEVASRAVLAMLNMAGNLSYAREDGEKMLSGVVVRHLVLPGRLDSTRAVIEWFAENAEGRALFSLMTQYTPMGPRAPNRYINASEYETLLKWLDEFGVRGYYQELSPDADWLPDFSRFNPFSSELSTPVWNAYAGSALHKINDDVAVVQEGTQG
ncbi:MAG: radical SAM protein [Treponema sp.]|nr:radical SAM protein [Treponema sp.]